MSRETMDNVHSIHGYCPDFALIPRKTGSPWTMSRESMDSVDILQWGALIV